MPRSYTETRLAPALAIHIYRGQELVDGAPVMRWAFVVDATVLDQTGAEMRRLSAEDVLAELTPVEQNAFRNGAEKMVRKLAQRLDVAEV